jgi:hypothetical protein
MKHFSFKIIILCLVAPPVLYLLAMHFFEAYLDQKYRDEIEGIYIGDTAPLFDGSITLKKAVNRNIDAYIAKDFLLSAGVDITVTVISKQGLLLYPDTLNEGDTEIILKRPIEVASENYAFLNEGLYLRVDANLNQNTLPANILLIFLIASAAFFLYGHYRAGVRRAFMDSAEAARELERLHGKEQTYAHQLDSITREREALNARLDETRAKLEVERVKSERNEEDLIEEIVALEKNLDNNLSEQEYRP